MALLLASVAHPESAATKERARLRQGPSAATELLGEIDAGTKLDLLGESGGWRQVRVPDGRVGWVWADHLALGDAPPPKPSPEPPAARPATEDLRQLRDDVAALKQRPEPASAADIERVRQEIERLAAAQREMTRRLDDRIAPAAGVVDPPTPDGIGTFAPALLLVGAIVGFAGSRLLQRRRDRRQRSRLRL
jgi:HAMP domain-containing protein